MKRNNFFICDYNQWVFLNDTRVTSLSEEIFEDLIQLHCKKYNHKFPQLYKRLATSDPYCFVKSEVMRETVVYWDMDNINPNNWKVLPDRRKSITCYNYQDNDPGNLYVVIPFDGANFGICPGAHLIESNITNTSDLIDQGFTRAYYNDPIKWLKGLNKRELWTSDSCLLISYIQWEKYFNK